MTAALASLIALLALVVFGARRVRKAPAPVDDGTWGGGADRWDDGLRYLTDEQARELEQKETK